MRVPEINLRYNKQINTPIYYTIHTFLMYMYTIYILHIIVRILDTMKSRADSGQGQPDICRRRCRIVAPI